MHFYKHKNKQTNEFYKLTSFTNKQTNKQVLQTNKFYKQTNKQTNKQVLQTNKFNEQTRPVLDQKKLVRLRCADVMSFWVHFLLL